MRPEGSLSLRTRKLGDSFDLLAAYPGHGGYYLEGGGSGIAAWPGSGATELALTPGDAAAIREIGAHAQAALRSIGAHAVAVGAVGFDPEAGVSLRIPAAAARRLSDGTTWELELMPEGEGPAGLAPMSVMGGSPREPFADVEVRENPSVDVYAAGVARAVSRMQDGELRKVVLARTIEVSAGHELDPRRLLHHLRAVDPQAYAFATPVGGERELRASLVGASPELLVSRRGLEIRSNPLAGSAPRSGDPDEDGANASALARSSKDRQEHGIVVDAIAEALTPVCRELTWDPEPVLRATANVWHLSTRFRGKLREPAPSVLELVAALHPTPAVCGTPRAEALELIRELEPFDRGRYAGAVGWIDAAGDGEWVIALRCAELEGDRATLYAGAGIVAASVPQAEVEETDRKFRAFLDALRWG
jgi:isochorismate synthase